MPIQKILKVGNSLGITLPAGLVKNLSLRPGDQVDVTQDINNTLTVNFVDTHQLSLGLNQTQKQNKKPL